MSREEDEKFESVYLEQRQRGYEVDVDLDDVKEALRSGITYGRATPDREMLLRLLQFATCADCDYSDAEMIKFIDEFLTLENQRGQNVLR